MVTSWYDTQQCRSGLHKSGKKAQQQEGRIIWTAARPPDREAEGPMWTAAATRPAVVVQRKPPVPRVRTVRTAARPAVGASCFNAPHPDHEVALDGLEPEVVRGMRREKFEPTQAVVYGRAADGPRQLRGHRCRTRRLSQCSRVVGRHPFQAWPATRVHRRVLLSLAPRHRVTGALRGFALLSVSVYAASPAHELV